MIDDIIELIVKLLCLIGGLGLMALVIMWLVAVPIVAVIFDAAFSGWMLIILLTIAIIVIGLIVKFIAS